MLYGEKSNEFDKTCRATLRVLEYTYLLAVCKTPYICASEWSCHIYPKYWNRNMKNKYARTSLKTEIRVPFCLLEICVSRLLCGTDTTYPTVFCLIFSAKNAEYFFFTIMFRPWSNCENSWCHYLFVTSNRLTFRKIIFIHSIMKDYRRERLKWPLFELIHSFPLIVRVSPVSYFDSIIWFFPLM